MSDRPGVGDLVRNADGKQRIVTDVRGGRLILRPKNGPHLEDETGDPRQVTLIARRGTWS
jgi:hypothetical protein